MKNLSSFPDLGRSAKLVKFSVELENVKPDNVLGASIREALSEGRIMATLNLINDCAKDNRELMNDIVGESLLDEIIIFMLPEETGAMAD